MMPSLRKNLVSRAAHLALLASAGFMLAGCAGQPGKTVVDYSIASHQIPATVIVTKPAKYSLYASDAPTPIYSINLQKDDEVGFVERGDGSVVAVATGRDIALTNALAKDYYWKAEEPKK